MTMTLSSKGQITLPVSLRRSLGLQPGDQLTVSNIGGKAILEKAVPGDFMKWAGKFQRPGAKAMRDEDADQVAAQAAAKHYAKKTRQ